MIRFILTPVALFALFLFTSFTPKKTHKSQSVYLKTKESYAKIQKNIQAQNLYNKIQISDKRFSDESVTAYFKNHRIELIVSETFGEAGKIRHEYYFNTKGELIVASNQLFTYKNMAQKADLALKSENRFFYSHNRVIKWLNEKNQVISLRNPDALPKSKYLLGKSLMFTAKLKENDKVIGQYQQNSNAPQFAGGKYAQCSPSGS
jgi:hypothetical protein